MKKKRKHIEYTDKVTEEEIEATEKAKLYTCGFCGSNDPLCGCGEKLNEERKLFDRGLL